MTAVIAKWLAVAQFANEVFFGLIQEF